MDGITTDIRRAVIDDEAGAKTKQGTGRKPEAGLLSREATAAVGSAFGSLTETMKKHELTLEDVVRETLRPMLKSWLDENLPRLAEQMVQAEIERVTRGR
jgi:cell pole-organizing protein PopZ